MRSKSLDDKHLGAEQSRPTFGGPSRWRGAGRAYSRLASWRRSDFDIFRSGARRRDGKPLLLETLDLDRAELRAVVNKARVLGHASGSPLPHRRAADEPLAAR